MVETDDREIACMLHSIARYDLQRLDVGRSLDEAERMSGRRCELCYCAAIIEAR